MWPALKACKHKGTKASVGEVNDHLSLLPDDILLSILSSFTLKEAARTSVLSHRWKDVWRCLPTLIFKDPIAKGKAYKSQELCASERLRFISWVNNVINSHMGHAIEELRVSFNLNKDSQLDILKWVDFAFQKHVKILDLDFIRVWDVSLQHNRCILPLERLPQNLVSNKRFLTSLRLCEVNVTTEAVEHILRYFPLLERFCILHSYYVTHLKVFDTPLALKHLEIFDCQSLQIIHISAPKLLSFKYYGNPIKLNVENATMLTEVFVGGRDYVPVVPSLVSLFKYFSQLEILDMRICMDLKSNSRINQVVPVLANLKHLKLNVDGGKSLLGWISLIEASSQVLQKFTLELCAGFWTPSSPVLKHDGSPLKCLETLEILGFVGRRIDKELATYVFEKSVVLKEVIVNIRPWMCDEDINYAKRSLKKLEKKVPVGAQLILKPIVRNTEDLFNFLL